MRHLRCIVDMRAEPAQRPRATRQGIIYADPRSRDWQQQFRTVAALQLPAPPFSTAVGVHATCFSTRHPDKLNAGDADNVLKNIMDALTNIAWIDDRLVVSAHIDMLKHDLNFIVADIWGIDTANYNSYHSPYVLPIGFYAARVFDRSMIGEIAI